MTTAAQSYFDSNYLHYYGGNAPGMMEWNAARYNQKKSKTLIGARSNVQARKRDAEKRLKTVGLRYNTIEAYLSGSLFKDVPELSEKAIVEGTAKVPYVDADTKTTLLDAKISTLEEFVRTIEKMVTEMYGQNFLKKIYSGYTAEIVKQAAQNKNITQNLGKGKVAEGIMRAILGQHNRDFFKVKDSDISELDTALSKILLLAKTLPDVEDMSGTFRSGSGSHRTVSQFSNESELIECLKDKVYKFFVQHAKVSSEAAVHLGLLAANKRGLERLNQVAPLVNNSTQKFDTHFEPDPKLKADLIEAGVNLKNYETKVSKSDIFSIIGDENGSMTLTTLAGFSVKDYQSVKFSPEGNGIYTANGKLKIQEGTSLFVALAREANMDAAERHSFAQLAVAHSFLENDDAQHKNAGDISEEELNRRWQGIITYISRRMLVNALAGLRNSEEAALFLVINGKIFTLENLIDKIITSEKTDSGLEYAEKNDAAGLERSTYVALNKWQFNVSVRPNVADALSRSKELEKEVYKVWADTKLRIVLNMVNMRGLIQRNIPNL